MSGRNCSQFSRKRTFNKNIWKENVEKLAKNEVISGSIHSLKTNLSYLNTLH